MKLNRKTLRKMILKEIKNITESQKEVGLPHKYTDMELYHHALNFLQSNPDLRNATPEARQKGNKLLRILHNAAQKAVQHAQSHRDYSESRYGTFVPGTSAEDTEYMRDVQGKLKMARNALASALGLRHKYSGRSAGFGDMIRAADPTGEKQRSGLRPDQVSDIYHDTIGRRHDDNDD